MLDYLSPKSDLPDKDRLQRRQIPSKNYSVVLPFEGMYATDIVYDATDYGAGRPKRFFYMDARQDVVIPKPPRPPSNDLSDLYAGIFNGIFGRGTGCRLGGAKLGKERLLGDGSGVAGTGALSGTTKRLRKGCPM